MMPMYGFVLTRLHARYSKDGINEDLVFKSAPAIAGGREWRGSGGKLEEGKVAAPINNFQARYAIRHEWTGPMDCATPVRGVWGGPPSGTGTSQPRPALDLAFVPRGKTQLASIVRQDVPEIGLTVEKSKEAEKQGADPAAVTQSLNDPGQSAAADQPRQPARKEKQGCAVGGGAGGWLAVLLAAAFVLAARRRAERDRSTRLDR